MPLINMRHCKQLRRSNLSSLSAGVIMPGSTLDPDNFPESDRQLGKGHDTDALGPSDISDSGSDVQGGYHALEEDMLPQDRGTNQNQNSHNLFGSPDESDSSGAGKKTTTKHKTKKKTNNKKKNKHNNHINPE